MPEIELLPSSDEESEEEEEEEEENEDVNKQRKAKSSGNGSDDDDDGNSEKKKKKKKAEGTDFEKVHPAYPQEESKRTAFRHFEVFVSHPGSVREVIPNADKAKEFKALGNEKFKAKLFDEAIELYSDGIDFAPEDDLFKPTKAILFCNRAACFLNTGHLEDVLDDCECAIELDPKYLKAYMRRAKAYEKMDELDSALGDWNKVVELDPSFREGIVNKNRVAKIVEEKNEKLKEEMMGKLKDLGNTVLGKFGLSLDNFNAVQDPETGSYSINFQQ